jgi:glycosyltransferase involved in cell wall biosynthesis
MKSLSSHFLTIVIPSLLENIEVKCIRNQISALRPFLTCGFVEIIIVTNNEITRSYSHYSNSETIISNESRVRITTAPKGIYAAMNRGIELSRGQYLIFMGSTDYLNPQFMKLVSEWVSLLHHSEYPQIILGTTLRGNSCTVLQPYQFPNHIVSSFLGPFRRYNLSHQSIIYRRDILLNAQGYDERFMILGDIDLNIRISRSNQPSVVRFLYPYFPVLSYHEFGGISSQFKYKFHDLSLIFRETLSKRNWFALATIRCVLLLASMLYRLFTQVILSGQKS